MIIDLEKLIKGDRKGTGALVPNATKEDELMNYRHEEIVANALAVSFSETSPERWKVYPVRDQNGSGTCVAQTIAKMAGILREQKTGEYVEYSATPVYQKRINKPQAGMIGTDALDIWRNDGVTLEHLVPSQKLTDAQIDLQNVTDYERDIAEISRLENYVILPAGNFERAVSTMVATGKPLMVWIWGEYDEWSVDVPKILHDGNLYDATVRHSVTATGNIGIYKGQIGFTIEDSWGSRGINGLGVRWITKEWFEKRNYFIAYPIAFKTYEEMGIDPAKPKYSFTRNLEYGMTGDVDVIALQNILKYEGLFPANVDSTGNYYEITRKAVLAWQEKHGVPTDGLQGRLVGVKTKRELNRLYSK